MERTDFRSRLEPVIRMFGRTFDVVDWTVYYQALADIPLPLFDAAIARLTQENRAFLPRPGEIREAAEIARRDRLALHLWRPCELCADAHGFVERVDGDGVTRLQRCGCREAHRRALLEAGIPSVPLLLEPAPIQDDAAYWATVPSARPSLAALPREIATDVKAIAKAHTMPMGENHPEKRERVNPATQTDLEGRSLPPVGL